METIKESDHSAEAEISKKNSTLQVEEVYTQIGGYSKFQIFATIVILTLEIPGAMVALSSILTGSDQVDFYCETANSSMINLTKEQLCNSTCKGNITSKEPYKSVVQEWNLICDKAWVSDTLTSVLMAGSLVGPIITAQIADRYGRKPAFFLICLLLGCSGIFSSLTTGIYTYAVSKFISGLISGGCMVAHMNYLMEFLTPSWRVLCGCVSLWPIGEMMLALLGYLFPSWRTLSWVTVLPAFVLLLAFPFLPESPRWLLCKNKTKDANVVLNKIAKWNRKRPLDSESMELLQASVLQERKDNKSKSLGWSLLVKDKQNLKRILIFILAWFSNALTYYGISFNMKNMSGNPYINVFLLGLLDWPAELSGIYFSNRFGRKVTFISSLAISICFLIAVAIIQIRMENAIVQYGTVILTLCLAGRFFNETSFAVMACFTGESFPTVIRSISFSICTVSSSLGGIVAPQMAYLGSIWAPGPYVVFCGFCTMSCIASLFLSEMKNQPLHDLTNYKK